MVDDAPKDDRRVFRRVRQEEERRGFTHEDNFGRGFGRSVHTEGLEAAAADAEEV